MGFRRFRLVVSLLAIWFIGSVTCPQTAEAGFCCLFGRRATTTYYPTAFYPAAAATTYRPALANAGCCGDAQCQQTVLRYVPEVAYRTVWQPVPVTTYRRTTTANPAYGGLPMTCLRPCTSYTYQARRVPYTTYKPVYTQIPLTVSGNCPTPTTASYGAAGSYGATGANCNCGASSRYLYSQPSYSTPSSPSYASPDYSSPSKWRPVPRPYSGTTDPADVNPSLRPDTSVRRIPSTRGYTSDWVRGEPIETRTYASDDRYRAPRDDDYYYRGRGDDYRNDRGRDSYARDRYRDDGRPASDRYYYENEQRSEEDARPTTSAPSIRTEERSSSTDRTFRSNSPFGRPATTNNSDLRPINDLDRQRPHLQIKEPKLLNPRDRTASSPVTRYASRIVWADEAVPRRGASQAPFRQKLERPKKVRPHGRRSLVTSDDRVTSESTSSSSSSGFDAWDDSGWRPHQSRR